MSMKNLTKNEVSNEQWTESKYKLVELVADIPSCEDAFFKYLYVFLVGCMAEGTYPMSIGHEDAIKEYIEDKRKREEEKAKEKVKEKKAKVIPEEKRMNDYVCQIVNNVMTIREEGSEDILRYIHIIVDDIIKEKQV